MNRLLIILSVFIISFLGITPGSAQNVSDEARLHYDRGMGATEIAKTPADYEAAVLEFQQATKLAPEWADAFYMLGLVQEKAEKFADAVVSLKRYLALAPNADDYDAVKSLITKIEYKRDNNKSKNDIMDAISTYRDRTGLLIVNCSPYGATSRIQYFSRTDEGLTAFIAFNNDWLPELSQTVPVEFDGSILKFKYIHYSTLSVEAAGSKCHWQMSIVAKLISVSPLKFKVKNDVFYSNGTTETFECEWNFE